MKLLFDTNVYFRLLYERDALDRYRPVLAEIAPRLYLSSVVRFELIQGARGQLGRARIRRATRAIERAGRIVVPLHSDWDLAGEIQGRIWDEHRNLANDSLQNDLLIACSALRIGAIVITENTADFTLIRRHLVHDFQSLDDLTASLGH